MLVMADTVLMVPVHIDGDSDLTRPCWYTLYPVHPHTYCPLLIVVIAPYCSVNIFFNWVFIST